MPGHRTGVLSGPEAERGLAALFRHLDVALAETVEGADPSRATLDELRPAAERVIRRVSDELARASQDAYRGHLELLRSRVPVTRVSNLLDLLAVLATLAGAGLGAWMAQRHARVSERLRVLQAERLDELEQFSSRVAHDILGPLQPISIGLEVLAPRLTDEPLAAEVLARLRRSVQRVHLIVEGLLAFAKAGARPPPDARVHLPTVLEGLRDDLLPTAEKAGIELVIGPAPDVALACAEACLTVVLQNLVRNALKFVGEASTRVVVARAELRTDAVRVMVQDSGPGVPAGLEERVFEPYVRAPGVRQPGLGLGLATVKRIVEAHGGRVGVESWPALGARFWVDLPLAR